MKPASPATTEQTPTAGDVDRQLNPVVVSSATIFSRAELLLIGVSSYPKGANGFIEVCHPVGSGNVMFATPPMAQGTVTLNTTAKVQLAADADPMVELRFMRKRKHTSSTGKAPTQELGTYTLDLRTVPTGLLTVPVTESAGKLKFSINSWDDHGAPVVTAAAAAENDDEDDLLPRLLPRFREKTDTGTITVAQLANIAADLGIDCDVDSLSLIIPAASRDAIFLEDCLVYLSQAIKDEREGDAGGMVTHGVTTGKEQTVVLAPFDYLLGKCRGDLPPNTELSLMACFTARNLLFLSSFIIFTVVSSAIIVYCSLTWLELAVERQSDLLTQSQDLIRIFMTSFERVSLHANSVSVKDKGETITNWMAVHWRNERNLVRFYAEREVMRLAPLLAAYVATAQADYVDVLVARLSGVHRALTAASQTVVPETLVQLVRRWQLSQGASSVAGASTLSSTANDVAWRWHTFARVQGVTVDRVTLGAGSEDTEEAAAGSDHVPWSTLEDLACPSQAEFAAQDHGAVVQYSRFIPASETSGVPFRVVATNFKEAQLTLCFVLSPSQFRAIGLLAGAPRVQQTDLIAEQHPLADDPVREEVGLWTAAYAFDVARETSPRAIALHSPRLGDGLVRVTPAAHAPAPWCQFGANCTELSEFLAFVRGEAASDRAISGSVIGDDGFETLVAAVYIPEADTVFTVSRKMAQQAEHYSQRQTDAFDFLNFEFVLTTELVLTGTDRVSNAILPQVTMFRFDFGCHSGLCERFYYAAETAFAAFTSDESGYMIKPDYRPEPVVSAWARMDDGINRAVVIERDVQDLRNGTLRNLIALADEINRDAFDTYEMMILRYEGVQASKTFDIQDETGCESIECIVRDGIVVWREDCQHCVMAPALTSNSSFEYQTQFRFTDQCAASIGVPCTSENLQTRNTIMARHVLENPPPEAEIRTITMLDYRSVEVVAAYVFLTNLSTTVVYKVDRETLEGPIIFSIIVCAIVASACTLVGLIGVLFATTRVINTIDRESEQYKQQVNAEKDKFASNISHLVPPHVAPKLKTIQQSVVVETSPNAVVINMDVVSFSELVRGWSAAKFISFSSYYFAIMSALGKRHGLFCTKAFGDVFIGIGAFGRIDEASREEAVLEAAHFCVIAVQLLSKEFAHNEALEWANARGQRRSRRKRQEASGNAASALDDAAETGSADGKQGRNLAVATAAHNTTINDRGEEVLKMPNVRIGCHTGSLVSGYMDVGSTPRFDAYGPTMQIAARMQATAAPGRVHCSEEFKDALDAADKNFDFEFDVQRRTILKGRVTHASYMIKSAHVPVPEDFLVSFGISRSHRDHDFDHDAAEAALRRAQQDGSSSVASSRHSMGSIRSGTSKSSFR